MNELVSEIEKNIASLSHVVVTLIESSTPYEEVDCFLQILDGLMRLSKYYKENKK